MTPIEELFFQIERKKIYISRSVLVNKSFNFSYDYEE